MFQPENGDIWMNWYFSVCGCCGCCCCCCCCCRGGCGCCFLIGDFFWLPAWDEEYHDQITLVCAAMFLIEQFYQTVGYILEAHTTYDVGSRHQTASKMKKEASFCGSLELSNPATGHFFQMFRWVETTNDRLRVNIHPWKLTWQWKIHHLKMYFLLKIGIFQCHVSFQGIRCLKSPKISWWKQFPDHHCSAQRKPRDLDLGQLS